MLDRLLERLAPDLDIAERVGEGFELARRGVDALERIAKALENLRHQA